MDQVDSNHEKTAKCDHSLLNLNVKKNNNCSALIR